MNDTHSILFVCLGNICRSPMAEGMFRASVEAAGRSAEFTIASAGTSSWHVGSPPDGGAQAATAKRGVDISTQRCRQVRPKDFANFDLLIAMDEDNNANLLAMAPAGQEHKVRLFLDYAPELGVSEVPDPWSQGQRAFDHALELIQAASIGLLESLPPRLRD